MASVPNRAPAVALVAAHKGPSDASGTPAPHMPVARPPGARPNRSDHRILNLDRKIDSPIKIQCLNVPKTPNQLPREENPYQTVIQTSRELSWPTRLNLEPSGAHLLALGFRLASRNLNQVDIRGMVGGEVLGGEV